MRLLRSSIFFLALVGIAQSLPRNPLCTSALDPSEEPAYLAAKEKSQTQRYSLKGKDISDVKLLRDPNYGAAYVAMIDGKKKAVRFHVSVVIDPEIPAAIGQMIHTAGYGVEPIGQAKESAAEVIQILGIPETIKKFGEDKKLAELTKRIDVVDYVDGIEFGRNGFIKNDSSVDLSSVDRALVADQLEKFMIYCNQNGILIGTDIQYFDTNESKVVIFDYDNYDLLDRGSVLDEQNLATMNQVLPYWNKP